MDRSPGQPKGVLPNWDRRVWPSVLCLSFQNKSLQCCCVLVSSTDGLVVWQGSGGPWWPPRELLQAEAPATTYP